MKTNIPIDCGNSPKMMLIKDFVVAMAERDLPQLKEFTTTDFSWHVSGASEIQGQEAFLHAISQSEFSIQELTLEKVLSHGKSGACSGERVFASGNKEAFAEFYEFSGVKGASFKSLTSYLVRIP